MSTILDEVLSGQAGTEKPRHKKKHCNCANCRRERLSGHLAETQGAESEDSNHLLGEVFETSATTTSQVSASSATPSLLSEETNAGGYTCYVGIDLQMSKNDLIKGYTCTAKNEKGVCIGRTPSSWVKSVPAMTAIYAPKGY